MPRKRMPGKEPEAQLEDGVVAASSSLGQGLTLRQSQFVGALLEQVLGQSPNRIVPSKAATQIGVPEEQAPVWARTMLDAPAVKNAIASQLQARIEASQATPSRWLAEVAKLALVEPDLRQFYHPDGTIKQPCEWTAEMASNVSEITCDEIWEGYGEERTFKGYVKRLKFHSRTIKTQALEMLAKYHKLIVQTLEVVGKDGKDLFPDTAQADDRARRTREEMIAALGVGVASSRPSCVLVLPEQDAVN